jgi:hypothetical protein
VHKLSYLDPAWQAGHPERSDPQWLRSQGPEVGVWVEHTHPPVFMLQDVVGQKPKILAGVPSGDPAVFKALVNCLTPPFYLLYLLHTPRGEGEPGRYQSGQLDKSQVEGFLERFGDFLRSDARHDFWLHSPADQATLVWDRHNLLHAYGPTDALTAALRRLGFTDGEPKIPIPHAHSYREEFDDDAHAVLDALEWVHGPLRSGDKQ